jgi:hypothetical protein
MLLWRQVDKAKNALDDADIGDLEGILSFPHCPAMRVMTDFMSSFIQML